MFTSFQSSKPQIYVSLNRGAYLLPTSTANRKTTETATSKPKGQVLKEIALTALNSSQLNRLQSNPPKTSKSNTVKATDSTPLLTPKTT